jgi:hypothetical protein
MRKTLSIPIYDCKVDVVVTKEFDEAVVDAGWMENTEGDGIVLHYTDNSSFFVVIFREGCTSPGNIAHEALHLTLKIMQARDIKFDFKNQEPIAYLHGFVVDGLHQIIFSDERTNG